MLCLPINAYLTSFCEKDMLEKSHNLIHQSTESMTTYINDALVVLLPWLLLLSFLSPLFIVGIQGKPLLASLSHLR